MRVVTGQMTKRAMVTGRTLGRKQSRMEYLKKINLLHLRLETLIWEYILLCGCTRPLALSVGIEQMLREFHAIPARCSLQHLLRLRQSALVLVLMIMV